MSDPIEIRVAPGSVAELTTLIAKMGELATVATKLGGTGASLDQLTQMVKHLGDSAGGLQGIQLALKSVTTALQELPSKLENAVNGVQRSLQTSGNKAGAALGQGIEQGITASVPSAKAALTKFQKDVERDTQNTFNALYRFSQKAQTDLAAAKVGSAAKYTVDDFRHLTGMPSRDEMVSFAAQLKAQMQEAMTLDKSKVRAASKYTVDDFRHLTGMPSRDEMVSFAAQLKAQMQEAMTLDKSKVRAASKYTVDDFRHLTGMPSRDEMVSFAAQLKAQMQEAMTLDKAKVRAASKYTVEDFRHLVGMPSRAEMATFSAQLKAELEAKQKDLYAAATQQSSAAIAAARSSGAWFSLRSGAKVNTPRDPDGVKLRPSPSEISSHGASLTKWSADANTAHSAARGLASGFNLLWLTWGNLIPLFAGAALSNGFMQIVKLGSGIGHSMEIIRVLGEESSSTVSTLTGRLVELGRSGPVGPKDIADAMKTLSLAGLDANQILMTTKDVLNFSVAGTVELQKAADVLTSVAAATGMGAEGFGRIGDIISKAAAISKSSVESMGEAFKTASVLNKQYGVSLEDIATGLSALNQLGIQGTAAGTSLRNMYVDLSGRTKEVSKTLKALNLDFTDSNGKFIGMGKAVEMLSNKLSEYDGKSQALLKQKLLSERGSKAIIELLDMYENASTKQKELFKNTLEEQSAAIKNSYGFQAMAAIELAQTTQKKAEAVSASVKSAFVQAFGEIQPSLQLALNAVLDLVRGSGFTSAITAAATGVANLTRAIAEHTTLLGTLLGLWVASRAALGLLGAAKKLAAVSTNEHTASVNANTIAVEANALAQKQAAGSAAAGGALTAIGGLAGALSKLNIILGIGTTAWMLWQMMKSNALAKTESDSASVSQLIKQAADESKRMQEQLKYLQEHGNLNGYAESASSNVRLAALEEKAYSKVTQAVKDEEAALAKLDLAKRRWGALAEAGNVNSKREVESAKRDYNLAVAYRLQMDRLAQQEISEYRKHEEGVKSASKAMAELIAAREKAAKVGTKVWTDPGRAGRQFNQDKPLPNIISGTLDEETQLHKQLLAEIDRFNSAERALLESKHKANLISDAAYQTQSFTLLQEWDARRVEETSRHYAVTVEIHNTNLNRLREMWEAAQPSAKSPKFVGPTLDIASISKTSVAYTQLSVAQRSVVDQYLQESQAKRMLVNATDAELSKLRDSVSLRERQSADDWAGKVQKEADAYSKAHTSIDLLLSKEKEKLDAEVKAGSVSEKTLAGLKARTEFENEAAKTISDRETALAKLAETEAAYQEELLRTSDESFTAGSAASALYERYKQARADVAKLREELAKLRGEVSAGAGVIQAKAEDVFQTKESVKLRDNIADAIVSGILKGRDGAKSTWVTFRDWLKNLFGNTVLKPVFQTVVSNVMGSVGSSFLGSAGGSAAGSFGGSMLGSSAGSFVGPGTTMGTALGSLGFDSAAYMAGAEAGVFGGTSGAMGWLASGEIGTGLSQMAGALGPYAIAIAALAIALNKKATPHVGGYAFSDASGTTDITAAQGGKQQAETQTAMATLSKGIAGNLNSIAATFGQEAGYGIKAVFESDNNDASWGIFNVMKGGQQVNGSLPTMTNLNKDPTKGMAEFGVEAAKGAREALLAMDIPAWAKKVLNDLGDSIDVDKLNSAVASIQETEKAIVSFRESMVPMGGVFTILSGLSSDAVAGLSKAAGGLDNLSSSVADYYQNYYTETERNTQSLSYLTAEFNKLGLGAMPATKEGLRQVIDGFIQTGAVSTEAGQQTLASLLGIASGYSKITDSSEGVSKARELEIELLLAQGNEIGALKLQRADELAALKKVNPALAVTKQLIWDIQDATKLANKTRDLEVERLNTLGLTVQATNLQRENELKILAQEFPTLVDNQKALWNLQDTRKVEQQLIEAQGKSAVAELELRKANLAALDSTNPALADLTRTLYAFQASATNAANKIPLWQGARDTGLTASSAEFYSELKGITADELQFAADEYMRSRWGDTIDPSDPSKLMRDMAMPAFQLGALQNSMAINRLIQQKNQNPNADKAYNDMLARGGSESPASQLDKTLQASNNAWSDLYDALKGLDKTMSEYIDNLDFNDLSNLSPEAQYAKAKADYAIAKAQVMAGDGKAMENMEKVMQRLLETSQAYNASGAGYGADMTDVKATWAAMSGKLSELINHAAAQVAATSAGLGETNNLLSSGNSLADKMARTQGLEAQKDK